MNKANYDKDLRKAGNAAIEEKNYAKAIEIYSNALLMKNIPEEEKGLLHSNRSHAYLQSAMECSDSETMLGLALRDADEVIKLRSSWWKGYFRAGLVYQYQKEWNRAIDAFNEALALNPELVDVKNCRDECRFDKLQTDMAGNAMSHGFKEEIDKYNEIHGSTLDADVIIKNYEKSMKSENREIRASACIFFGLRYIKGVDGPQDIKKGLDLLQQAVDAGSPAAMVELGVLYMEGKGVERNIKKAVNLFEKATHCEPKNKKCLNGEHDGTTHAQFHIGLCFENGTGKPLDYFQARKWYEKASERGHAGAANNIAILYDKGKGGEKSSVRAKQYFSLSASRGNLFLQSISASIIHQKNFSGNVIAMESLAWKCLSEREYEQAENWYTKALEAGNNHSIQNKEKFYKILEEARNYIKEVKAQFQPSDSSAPELETKDRLPVEMLNIVEAIEKVTNNKPSIAGVVELADSPLAQYWNNFEEIQKRAAKGHGFALTLLIAMGHFAEGIADLKKLCSVKMNHSDTALTQEQCIHELADSFRATEIISFFEPSELPVLMRICKAKISNQKSDLDLDVRIVYCFLLTVSQNSEMFSFSKICHQMYPDEVFFYKMHAAAFAVRQDFDASMQVSDQGLNRFPTDEDLLFCKAGAMKMIKSCRDKQVVAAYKEFIKHAPFDERMIPEAYYNMAFYSTGDEKRMYYKKGLEAELKMLPCLLPYQSNMKSLLDALQVFEKKEKNEQPNKTAQTAEQNLKTSSAVNLQLTNPARVQYVQKHRETLKKMTEFHRSKEFIVKVSMKTPKDQEASKHPDGSKEITIRDMNPHKDEVYKKRFINLLIIEDPMFGLLTAIHVVVRDDNGDCLICSFYNLDHFDENVRRSLCFGSKITVMNPYYRLATDGNVALRVDDPKTIIYRSSGKDNPICRYCWKENPQHSCGICKRAKYCCRSCQTDDWKNLKHKLICGLKYFDDM